jgi:hypothetical protein
VQKGTVVQIDQVNQTKRHQALTKQIPTKYDQQQQTTTTTTTTTTRSKPEDRGTVETNVTRPTYNIYVCIYI